MIVIIIKWSPRNVAHARCTPGKSLEFLKYIRRVRGCLCAEFGVFRTSVTRTHCLRSRRPHLCHRAASRKGYVRDSIERGSTAATFCPRLLARRLSSARPPSLYCARPARSDPGKGVQRQEVDRSRSVERRLVDLPLSDPKTSASFTQPRTLNPPLDPRLIPRIVSFGTLHTAHLQR